MRFINVITQFRVTRATSFRKLIGRMKISCVVGIKGASGLLFQSIVSTL
jgi:hypothetical protein